MKIKYINYGTGNRVGDVIYLNKDLKKYPRLHSAILLHEKNHSGKFELKDFKLDLFNNELRGHKKEFYSFVITHPSSWINFFPLMKIEGKIYFDFNLMILWLIIIVEIYLISLIF